MIPAGRPGGALRRLTGLPLSSPTPRADATSAATSPSAATPASSTKCTTRCSAWLLTACARRVLPRPPVPTIDVTRDARSRPATAAMSSSRPSSRLGSCRTQRGQRVAVPAGPAVRALAQREPGPGMPQRREMVAGPGPLLTLGRAEQDRGGIDLVLAQREAVSARGADDDPGAEPGPGPGHKDLEGLERMLWLPVRPQRVHQPGGAAPHVRVPGQERKQALQPGAGDLQAAITAGPAQRSRRQISRASARRRG
jgi:hypothetical protein